MSLKTISDIFENSERLQVGTVRTKCQINKITSVNEIASAYEYVKHKLLQTKEWGYENFTDMGSNATGLIRSDANPDIQKECIIWSINHYFGLNRHPEVIQSAIEALQAYGTGSGTSAMSGGHSSLHKQLERRLAEVMKKETAVLFSTGFTANFGALSALGKSGKALFLLDQECHASIFDGVKVTGCNYLLFKHNDINDLQRFLTKNATEYENIFVVVESVYSMSGEEAPLKEIIELKQSYPFYLFVDEAHGFGLYDVGGLCSQLGISEDVDFIVTT